MRTIKKYFAAILILAGMLTFVSCDKEDNDNELSTESVALTNETAATEMAEEEIFTSINHAIELSERDNGLKSATILNDCATISIKPLIGGYPKTITIDFGTGCSGTRGIRRSGAISFSISDSLRTPGAQLEVTFNDFSVNGFSVSGAMSFENTSAGMVQAFYQETDLVMKTKEGIVITKTKTANRQWIEGSDTEDDISDDVFQVTSTADVNTSSGASYSYTVKEPLVISASCDMIKEGVIELTTSEKEEPVTIDFGDGECDLKILLSEKNIAGREINLTK